VELKVICFSSPFFIRENECPQRMSSDVDSQEDPSKPFFQIKANTSSKQNINISIFYQKLFKVNVSFY
jgi:hypothetical protein